MLNPLYDSEERTSILQAFVEGIISKGEAKQLLFCTKFTIDQNP